MEAVRQSRDRHQDTRGLPVRPLLPWPQLDLELNIPKMYQAAEEGEGGRAVGEGASVEARPGSRNSAETPLNPSKLDHPFPLIESNSYATQCGQNISKYFLPGCSTVSQLGTSFLRSLEPSR